MKKIFTYSLVFILLFLVSCCSTKNRQYEKSESVIISDTVIMIQKRQRTEDSIRFEEMKREESSREEKERQTLSRTETAAPVLSSPPRATPVESVPEKSLPSTPPAAGELEIMMDNGLMYGDITYKEVDTMVVGRTDVLELTISYDIPISRIVEEVHTFISEGELVSEPIRIAPKMLVTLIDPTNGVNFTIIPISPEEQLIEVNDITKWNWNVTPLTKGNNKLVLSVNIVLENGIKNIQVYEDYIYVYSDESIFERFWNWFIDNWEPFLSLFIIPLVIWGYNRFIKKKKDDD